MKNWKLFRSQILAIYPNFFITKGNLIILNDYAHNIHLESTEDLSNMRKNAKAVAGDAIELSEEYLDCFLSKNSESKKLHTH